MTPKVAAIDQTDAEIVNLVHVKLNQLNNSAADNCKFTSTSTDICCLLFLNWYYNFIVAQIIRSQLGSDSL